MKSFLLLWIMAALLVGLAFALPSNQGIDIAKEKNPVIGDNGNVQLPEKELTKVVFIRYKPGKEPLATCGNGICEPRENWKNCPKDCPKETTTTTTIPANTCYGFLSGAKPKWNWVENYYYSNGLGKVSAWATKTWDDATSATIFGSALPGAGQWGVYDNKNSITFGEYSDPNVIAVTALWFNKNIIYEYDIMFDTDYFPGTTDLATVALHEFGHAAGLDDLYKDACDTEVMYGYYHGIDIDLGSGDLAGIHILYGV